MWAESRSCLRPGRIHNKLGVMPADLSFATTLAEEAGALLLERYLRGAVDAQLKSDHTLVTEADLAANTLIADALAREYPSDCVISEEGATRYSGGDAAAWVVDPLDGTANFALGFPVWGVSVARIVDSEVTTAVANFPALGELYSASAGQGALLNGNTTSVSQGHDGHPVRAIACCSRALRRYHVNLPYKVRVLGAAAYTLCCVARGSASVALETTPKIWDVAAASLIVREAGGVFEPFEGPGPLPLDAKQDYTATEFPTLAASDPNVASLAREAIQPR